MVILEEPSHRYLIEFNIQAAELVRTDVLIIGSGVAGLRAALEASNSGSVAIVTKSLRHESNTYYAQGGIAAALNPDDNKQMHIEDTISAGKGLCENEIVDIVVREGIPRVEELISWGVQFDKTSGGEPAFTAEGGHSAKRILHCHGDHTGKEIERGLLQECSRRKNITFFENNYVVDILTSDNRTCGAVAQNDKGKIVGFLSKVVILASGGCGQLFRETTNPNITTGDGFAMALRAGCVLRDMEFVQFHPTTLYIAGAERTLITEAARGEGALLKNRLGHRFMPDYHPQSELAPRDVVSASMIREMKKTEAVCVYLDMTQLGEELTSRRFPNICEVCQRYGLNPSTDLIPVRPSVHYMIGGVETDSHGRTAVQGLFAAGEVASSGLNGANRLGSNSLLEGLVFGYRAGLAAGDYLDGPAVPAACSFKHENATTFDAHIDIRDMINTLKATMWRKVGIEREEIHLQEVSRNLDFWCSYALVSRARDVAGWTLQNMLTLAKVITRAALRREETRGTHQRLDFPYTDDKNWKTHSRYQRVIHG
ncbi:L-aspartate oxidase [Planctomycetota bacterium]